MQTMCWILGLFSTFGCVLTLKDKGSLIHDHAKIHQHLSGWPDIGEEVDKAAKSVEKAVQDSVDAAANATATAIQSVVDTGHSALVRIREQAYIFGNATNETVRSFMQSVKSQNTIKTFKTKANATLDTFLTSFIPIISGVNASGGALETVLNAAGFLYLSQEVKGFLTQAVDALNETSQRIRQAGTSIQDLDENANTTEVKIAREVSKSMARIQSALQAALTEVNTTFDKKMNQSFEILINHLVATVDGVLPESNLKTVKKSLNSLYLEVASTIQSISNPTVELNNGFSQAIEDMHAGMPVSMESLATTVGPKLVALIITVCVQLCFF